MTDGSGFPIANMPKIPRGRTHLVLPEMTTYRIGGIGAMESRTADELYALANKLDAQIKKPNNSDDPKWLKRWAEKCRWMAAKKEKAKEHKQARA